MSFKKDEETGVSSFYQDKVGFCFCDCCTLKAAMLTL